MADCDVTQQSSMTWDAADDLYNKLSAKLSQLEALLGNTFANCRESFESMNDTARDNYMWACFDMASDCGDLLSALSPAITNMKRDRAAPPASESSKTPNSSTDQEFRQVDSLLHACSALAKEMDENDASKLAQLIDVARQRVGELHSCQKETAHA